MYLLCFESEKLESVFLKFFYFIFKYFFHWRLFKSKIFWLRFDGVNLMLFFFNKILKVISLFFNKFKPLLVLILLWLILVNPFKIKFLEFIFEFCFSTGKSEFKIVKFSWKLKHVFLLFFNFWKKFLIRDCLLLCTSFFLFN